MKKVIKNIPVVTIVLVAVNLIVTKYFNTATVMDAFGINDILAIFSHADGGHIAYNMGEYALLGSIAEILLKNRRWIYISFTIVSIVSVIISNEVRNAYTIGASGWVAAIPFVLVFAGLLFWYENKRYSNADYGLWAAGLGGIIAAFAVAMDYALSHDAVYMATSDVNHATHLHGAITGIVLAVIASAVYGTKKLVK